jgi:hypothetical protein
MLMHRFGAIALVCAAAAGLSHAACAQAVRKTPDSTNATLPYSAPQYQRDVNTEVKALWARAVEKLASVSGTNTITATAAASDASSLTAYNNLFLLRPANTNTGAVTLNIDSIGAKNVLDVDGNALSAGELVASRDHLLYYDGTAFRLLANGSAPPPTVASPGPVLVSAQTASGASSIPFSNVLDNTYDAYEIILHNIKCATNDVAVTIQVGTGSTPTWVTSGYRWSIATAKETSAFASEGSTSDTSVWMTPTTANGKLSNASGSHLSGRVRFQNPEVTTDYVQLMFDAAYNQANGATQTYRVIGAGAYATVGAITSMRFACSSGNISGTARLYGWPK